jgi:hypothetical protein
VIATDPNIASVELVSAALGDLCDELVLVGGCAASLLIDAPAAPAKPARSARIPSSQEKRRTGVRLEKRTVRLPLLLQTLSKRGDSCASPTGAL